MSKRSELRRLQKSAEKKKTKVTPSSTNAIPVNVLYGSQESVQRNFGLSVSELKIYPECMESEIKKDFEQECIEKINKAEEYAAVANLLITIYALKMSRKNREHTKDLIHRMLDNYNAATEYLNRVGAKEAYRQAHNDLGVTFEFDSDSLNEEFGFTTKEE